MELIRRPWTTWCFNQAVSADTEPATVVTAHREIAASAEEIFELIADPAHQPRKLPPASASEARGRRSR
jgi:hypothetical protein